MQNSTQAADEVSTAAPENIEPEQPPTFSELQLEYTNLTMFRGNPERNLSAVGTVPRRPKLLWRFQTKTKLEGSYEQRGDDALTPGSPWPGLGWTGQPVYYSGRVYFGSSDSYVYCIEPDTARFVWYYPNHHCVKGSISIFNDLIYHGGRDNKIHCYTLDGEMVWETRTGQDMDSNPVVVNGRGFIGGEDRHIYSFDPVDGKILWQTPTSGSVESSPCVVDDKVIVGSSQGRLYCLSVETGEPIWEFATLGDTDSTPCHWDGRIYAACATGDENETGHVWCIDLDTGEKIWHVPMSRGIWASPAINPDKAALYIGCANGWFYALRMEDGSLIWKKDLNHRIWSSAAVTDGCVLVGVRDGLLWNLDENTGDPIWVFNDGFDIDATPCVADGLIIMGSQSGWVYCIGEAMEDEEINSHWFETDFPMHQRPDRNSSGIVTISNPAPPPGTYQDTSHFYREGIYEPVYGPGWRSAE
jgi:outer membrane protein assembly factor BamB